jgi:hypothetical protein
VTNERKPSWTPLKVLGLILALALPPGVAAGSALLAHSAGADSTTVAIVVVCSMCALFPIMWSIPIGYSIVKIVKARRTGDYS